MFSGSAAVCDVRAVWFQLNLFTCSGRDVYRKVQGRDHPAPSAIVNISGTSTHESTTGPSDRASVRSISDESYHPTHTPSPVLSLSLSEEGDEEVLTKKEKEERRIAEMGRPMLGEHVKLEVFIEESYEFKVGSDSVLLMLKLIITP